MRNTPITMGITLMAGAVMWASTVNTIDISRHTNEASVTQTTTGRVKVDRCIRDLKAAHRAKLSEASVDKAQVTCSAITKDADAKALYRWIRKGHKDALQIVG
jgi:molybdenum cofactor biosynthesis enzyme MoaA